MQNYFALFQQNYIACFLIFLERPFLMTINAIISWPQSSFRQFSHTKENCAIAGELYLQFDQNKILYKTHLTKNEAVELGIENNSELYHALSSAIQHNGLSELKNQYKRALFEITSKAGHTP